MSRLPRLSAVEAIRLLAKRGFHLVRQSGAPRAQPVAPRKNRMSGSFGTATSCANTWAIHPRLEAVAPWRTGGSHKIFKNDQGIRATIPFHTGKTLHPKLVKQLLHDLGLSLEEAQNLIS